jgi:hypothetical protein
MKAPFISDPQRDASDVIAGFVYQVDLTILRWLQLKENEALELERGEDLDVVQVNTTQIPEPRTLEQIKRRSSPLSLRSPDALIAVAHFCEHRKKNPSMRLRFSFITTGTLARERAWDLPGSAIESWQAIYREQLSDAEQEATLQAIQRFLRQCRAPIGFDSEAWALLEEILKEENHLDLLDLIHSFEWSLGVIDYPELEDDIKRELIARGIANDAGTATAIFERLFLHVFKRLTEKGLKRLTVAELRPQLRPASPSEAEVAFLEYVRDQRILLQSKVASLEHQVAQHERVLASLETKTTILDERIRAGIEFSTATPTLDLPALVDPAIPRAAMVDEILRQLPNKTWVNVVGEPGAGKTQLCLLAANRANAQILWINLREYTPEQACSVLDLALQAASGVRSNALLQGWYRSALSRLGAGKLLVLDDLPRVVSGGALGRRLDALCAACEQHGTRMLSTTYFELPQTFLESHSIVEIHAPRFTQGDIEELFAAHGAPKQFAGTQYADFLLTLTQGLPILVAAGVRLLETTNWQVTWNDIQGFFSGEFARGIKKDARVMIESTIADSEARELLYRLTCVMGPVSKDQIERIAQVPTEIRLGLEKLDQLVGLWAQPYGKDTYLLSPLVGTSLSALLDSKTRRGVHALLGALLLKRRTRTPMDIVRCVLHFQQADLLDQAALVLVRALMKLTEINHEVPNESLISSIWTGGPLPEAIDINIRLHLRALQIGFADKRGQDFSILLVDLDKLMTQAELNPDAQVGVFAAAGSITIRFARKYPLIANRYLLSMLKSGPQAVLRDGTRLSVPPTMAIESLLWATANATSTDEEISNWLDTVKRLTPEQLARFGASELATDNSTVICDLVWLREYRKTEPDQDWPSRDAILQLIENTASEVGLGLLRAAAVRARLTILAESQRKLDAAIVLAEKQLALTSSDQERFLIREVIGRQLAYANRWEEALRWMTDALQLKFDEYGLLRRNLLVTASEAIAIRDPQAALEYTNQSVEIAKSSGLEPIRIAESLAEHGIALWNAGHREDAFLAFQEGVDTLFKARDQRPHWTQAFLLFLHSAGFFSGISLWGKPPNPAYAPPYRGMFLNLDNTQVEKYQPLQDGLLLLRTAMFAEGVGETSAAARWAKAAFGEARRQSGADMLFLFLWLPIPDALLNDNYSEAIQQAYAMSQLGVPDASSLAAFEIASTHGNQIQEMYTERRVTERALLFGVVPTAFRLATLRFDRDITPDLDAVVSLLQNPPVASRDDWNKAADLIRHIFSAQRRWQDHLADASGYYAEKRFAFFLLSLAASLFTCSLKQSLATQVRLAMDLDSVFKISPSIRYKLAEPFFIRFWAEAVRSGSAEFRTSASHTQKSYAEAVGSPFPVRLKKLLASMVFCTGIPLTDNLKSWLETNA